MVKSEKINEKGRGTRFLIFSRCSEDHIPDDFPYEINSSLLDLFDIFGNIIGYNVLF